MEEQFETLESARDFVSLLADTVAEAKQELTRDVQRESAPSRRLDALRLAAYNVGKLELHLNRCRRILNDLRTLRRLLFEERESNHAEAPDGMTSSVLHSNSFTATRIHAAKTVPKSLAA
jgi:hypothetical protein